MSEATKPLQESGDLPNGALVDGELHTAFVLRLPTIQDNIDAVDLVGSTNGVALSTALFSFQLVKLGTLKPEQITFELIAGMHPSDFNELEAAAAELEKKRVSAVAAAKAGTASGLPSVPLV